MSFRFEQRSAMDLRPLRFLVLWPHKASVEECLLEADFLTNTYHFAAINEQDEVVACCSVMSEPREIEGEMYPMRLRAMASHSNIRGNGVARKLLEAVNTSLHQPNLWCDAREVAVPFYKKCGWQVKSEAYNIPLIGTHYLMVKSN